MYGKEAAAVFYRDERIDRRVIDRMTPEGRASMIRGKAGRQDQADAPAASRQRQRAFEE